MSSCARRAFVKQQILAKGRKRGPLPIQLNASDCGRVLLCLALGAVFQGCAPSDVHVHPRAAISDASRALQPPGRRGRLGAEFLEATRLEGSRFGATRVAEQRYLQLALAAG